MNGIIGKWALAGCLGCVAATGCVRYRDLVDPCWPERYNYASRQEVHSAFAPQVRNGHALDQTVWNYHFDTDESSGLGTDRLNAAGLRHLVYLSRRRPEPDAMVFVQTAYDIPYDPDRPDDYVQRRRELDQRRAEAVRKYLTAQTAGRPVPFDVVVHDPGEVGLAGVPARYMVAPPTGFYNNFTGTLPAGGLSSGATGGAAVQGTATPTP